MCGRYTSTTAASVLADVFGVDEIKTEELPPRFNVAPSQPVYAVAERRPGQEAGTASRQLGTFQWGLVPGWAKDPSGGARMINARAETVATRPAYRDALVRRRCIIPADAFYEWQKLTTASGRAMKVPHAIRRADRGPLAFAGLWEVWRSPEAGAPPLRSCAIITTRANDVLAPIHDRMPVVLPAAAWAAWLDPSNHDVAALLGLLVPLPSDELELWPVTPLVNRVANEGPELLEPAPGR
jgi:putative SOS response-associated peptidase YedK